MATKQKATPKGEKQQETTPATPTSTALTTKGEALPERMPATNPLCRWCGRREVVEEHGEFCSAHHAMRWKVGTASANEREAAEILAGDRHPEASIAGAFEVSSAAWARMRKQDQGLREALARGRAREHRDLVEALYVEATQNGNTRAAEFLLRTRHGYDDKKGDEATTRVELKVTLPQALTPEQYDELLLMKRAGPVIDAARLRSEAQRVSTRRLGPATDDGEEVRQ